MTNLPMKVFIRSKETGEFLCKTKEWSKEMSCALDFKSSIEALTFCGKHRIANSEILMSFGEARYDVVLPAFEGRDWQKPGQSSPPLP